MQREVIIPASEERRVTRKIERIVIDPRVASVEVTMQDYEGSVSVKGSATSYSFRGSDYEELLSEYPVWAPTKPAGVFRPSDIFAYLDYLEEQSDD